MSLVTNAVIIMLVVSIVVTGVPGVIEGIGCQYGLNCQSAVQAFLAGKGNQVSDFLVVSFITTLGTLALSLAGVALLSGQLGLISFPNPYLIFAGFTAAIIVNWAILPFQLFYLLPAPVNMILIGGFSFAIVWGAFQFFHGTGES